MDFRDNAAEATLKTLECASISFNDLAQSGCVRVTDDQSGRLLLELGCLTISTICLLNSILALPLKFFGVISAEVFTPMLIIGLCLLLVMRSIKTWILRLCLKGRKYSLLQLFKNLPSRAVQIENADTCKKVKILTEDEGICLLDAANRRLIIEGYSFRYLIYGKDVSVVEPLSAYSMSGAAIQLKVCGEELRIALNVAGQGPIVSLIESFFPQVSAKDFTVIIRRTLFGKDGRPKPVITPIPPPSDN